MSSNCPKCGKKLRDEVFGKQLHDKAIVYCPFCGAELVVDVQGAPKRSFFPSFETPLQTVGFAGTVMGAILVMAAMWAASYNTDDSILGKVYPFAIYVFPLGIFGAVLIFGGIVLVASGSRKQ